MEGAMRLLLLIACVASLAAALPVHADDEVAEGLPAPGFQLRTLNPEAAKVSWVNLEHYVGAEPEDPQARAVVLSFFASWCGPCQKELPYLQQLHQMYREQGLRVIAVDIDKDEAGIAQARKAIAANGITYPVGSDRFNLLARRYLGDKSPLPSVFIIRKDGTVAKIAKGYSKDASSFLLAEVQRVLGLSHPPK
jgi:thiol-disulfide isomerase/thioredoxin